MKIRCIFLLGLLIFLLLMVPISAIENNVGGNAKIAGIGFTQVSNNSSFWGNPASFSESKASFSITNSELFATGIVYNYLEAAICLKDSCKLNFGFESVSDKDQIDNSGYSQRLGAIGLSSKVKKELQLGISVTKSQYGLLNEDTGNGYAFNIGMLGGPFTVNNLKIKIGFKVDYLLAYREYKTDRKEIPKPEVVLGLNVSNNDCLFAVDLKSDDFRCGVEYRVIPSLVLRGGSHNGEPTLGVGIVKGAFHIDYAYWLSEICATHRIGTSISF